MKPAQPGGAWEWSSEGTTLIGPRLEKQAGEGDRPTTNRLSRALCEKRPENVLAHGHDEKAKPTNHSCDSTFERSEPTNLSAELPGDPAPRFYQSARFQGVA